MIVFYMIFCLAVFVLFTVSIIYFSAGGKTRANLIICYKFLFELITIILLPFLYLLFLDGATNDCCGFSATFSPEHKVSIYILMGLSITTYFISSYRKRILPPVLEILLNSLLIIGSFLVLIIMVHIFKQINIFALIFCLPILMLFLLALRRNHRFLLSYMIETDFNPQNRKDEVAWTILTSQNKFLYLILFCFPILFFIASVLILFGQKPDSMIRAFTDTYYHSFSQLDHLCKNVDCGGHYLCSVAANGHRNIVKPQRYGERLGKPIICNRQLLVANAFEELVWLKTPKLHRVIRHNYDRVGTIVHKYYGIFNNKYISDIVYLLMKPLEWMFIFVLYLFDTNPENRIAKQYLKPFDRKIIDESL